MLLLYILFGLLSVVITALVYSFWMLAKDEKEIKKMEKKLQDGIPWEEGC